MFSGLFKILTRSRADDIRVNDAQIGIVMAVCTILAYATSFECNNLNAAPFAKLNGQAINSLVRGQSPHRNSICKDGDEVRILLLHKQQRIITQMESANMMDLKTMPKVELDMRLKG